MSVVKIKKRENPYVQIDKTGIQDSNLSWKATGLLTYLVGRPDDWKVVLEHLASCKTDGITACKSALRELRTHNYCHFFELRKNGKIVETFYMIYEIPTPYTEELRQELLSSIDDPDNFYTLVYKKVDGGKEETTTNKKKNNNEKKDILPQVENPLAVNPLEANHRLLIKEDTKERVNKERSTTKEKIVERKIKEKNSSSNYEFLNLEKYSLLNPPTIINIKNNIKNLTEKKFDEIYNLTLKYINSGRGRDFNAILFKALKGEWYFTPLNTQENNKTENINKENINNTLDNMENLNLKTKWLSYYSGISKNIKKEMLEIIKDIPLEILNKNKSKLSRMSIYEFQNYLYHLRKQVAM